MAPKAMEVAKPLYCHILPSRDDGTLDSFSRAVEPDSAPMLSSRAGSSDLQSISNIIVCC